MQKIPLNLAESGFVLAKPIERDNGMVLVAQGTELTEAVIARLENMNIERIVVEGNPVDMDGAGGGTVFGERVERMDHLFRLYDGDRWMMRVNMFLKRYFSVKAAQLAAEEAARKAAAEAAKKEAEENAETGETDG